MIAWCSITGFLAHLDRSIDIFLVNADGDAHQHVLRTLGRLAVDLQKIGTLQRLEAEIRVAVVAVVHDRRVQALREIIKMIKSNIFVRADDLVDFLVNHRAVLACLGIHPVVQVVDDFCSG